MTLIDKGRLKMKVSEVVSVWRKVITMKKIKTSVRGKRAEQIIEKLLNKHPADEIVSVFASLPSNSRFELWWLLNDKAYERYLKSSEAKQRKGSSEGIEPSFRNDLEYVFNYFIRMNIPKIRQRKMTYQELLMSLPSFEPQVQSWLLVDPVYRELSKLRIIQPKETKHLKALYRKKSIRQKLETEFQNFVEHHPDLREIISEELEVLEEFKQEV